MPEGLEAEIWRHASGGLVDRTIVAVETDPRVTPDGFADLVVGTGIVGIRRRGKVLLIDTTGPVIGLHFGMTGRLEIDGQAAIVRLEYASGADRAEWDRLRLWTRHGYGTGGVVAGDCVADDRETPVDGVPALRLNDPRRLGRVSIDPDVSLLGPDLLTLTSRELTASIGRRRRAVKAVLLDQQVVAGLGNLCADEVLFWAGVAPMRPIDELTPAEIAAIARSCRERLATMLSAGGSTHGVLSPTVRAAAGPCPLDGGPLERTRIAGRTAVWCRTHQR